MHQHDRHITRCRRRRAAAIAGLIWIAMCWLSPFAALAGDAPKEQDEKKPDQADPPAAAASHSVTEDIPLSFYQIAIEAIVVEVNEKYSRQIGIQYTYARENENSDGVPNDDIVQGIDMNAPNTPPGVVVPQMNIIPGGVNFTEETRTLGAGIEAGRMDIAGGQFGVRLRGLIEEGKAQIRSRPLAVTLNNELVKIETADKVPYQDVTFNDSGGGKVSVQFEPVGVILHVQPKIQSLDKGLVELDLKKLEVSAVGQFLRVNDIQRPVFVKSEANTNVVVRNHDTLVIGGFKIEQSSETGAGVPFLRRIPIVKYAFGSESTNLERRDVLFYITPHILPPGVQPTLPPKFDNREPVEGLMNIPPLEEGAPAISE